MRSDWAGLVVIVGFIMLLGMGVCVYFAAKSANRRVTSTRVEPTNSFGYAQTDDDQA